MMMKSYMPGWNLVFPRRSASTERVALREEPALMIWNEEH